MKKEILYSPKALRTLKGLDPKEAAILLRWLEKKLGGEDQAPPGQGPFAVYRLGRYRILVDLKGRNPVIFSVREALLPQPL